MRALRTLMLGLGLALCPGVHAESAVYFLDHTIRAPGHAGTMRTLGFNRLALDTGPRGEQRLHTRPCGPSCGVAGSGGPPTIWIPTTPSMRR